MQKPLGQYAPPKGTESETQPGSRGLVLRNRFGILSKREMDQREFEALLQMQNAALQSVTAQTRFTAKMICRLHRDWLGEIYDWAGTYRTVEMSKAGFQWLSAFRVAPNMENFEAGLLKRWTPCRPAPLAETALRVAQVHAEFLLIHPFRDGNGRIARFLADLMFAQAGFVTPDYGFGGPGSRRHRAEYLTAVKRGYLQDYEPLVAFFSAALERSSSGVNLISGLGSPVAPSKTLES